MAGVLYTHMITVLAHKNSLTPPPPPVSITLCILDTRVAYYLTTGGDVYHTMW